MQQRNNPAAPGRAQRAAWGARRPWQHGLRVVAAEDGCRCGEGAQPLACCSADPASPRYCACSSSAVALTAAACCGGAALLAPAADLEQVYELDRQVGEGVEGAVYLATERSSGQQVAIKLIER